MPKTTSVLHPTYLRVTTFPKEGPVSSHSERVGIAGEYQQVSYFPEGRRRKPSDLFGSGTALMSINKTITDPVIEQVVHDVHETRVYQYPVSWLGNAETASLPRDTRLGYRLNNQLYANIKSQNLNLAVSLAEFRSTANTVGDLAKNVASFLLQPKARLGMQVARSLQHRFQRERWRERVRTLKSTREKDAVNSYLAYSYGLVPMMSDITGSLEQLNRVLEDGYTRTMVLRGKSDLTARQVHQYSTCNGVLQTNMKVMCRYTVDTRVQGLAQVGITNPAAAVYEMIPYSFVFDWIIPVGDYLSSLDALTGVSNIVRVEGMKEDRTWSSSRGHRVVETFKFRTAPQVGEPPAFKLMYEPSRSIRNLASAIALLRQRHL